MKSFTPDTAADVEKTQAPADLCQEDQRRIRDRVNDVERRTREIERGYGMVARELTDSEKLQELFRYHPPTPETLPKFAAINQAAKNFAEVLLQNCPPCADRSAAIRQIREARMWANAAIALDGLSL